jgi:hypothetical protein
MTWKVRVETGKGTKNHAVMESIPLPNRKRVCAFIKRNPMVRSNTIVKVKNLSNGKITRGTQYDFCSKFRKMKW